MLALALLAMAVYLVFRRPGNEVAWVQCAIAAAALELPGEGVVDLGEIAAFRWDRLHVFPPYFSLSEVRDALDREWMPTSCFDAWLHAGVPYPDDSQWLAVFTLGPRVSGWLVLNYDRRACPDALVRWRRQSPWGPFRREEARFSVQEVTWRSEFRAWELSPFEEASAKGSMDPGQGGSGGVDADMTLREEVIDLCRAFLIGEGFDVSELEFTARWLDGSKEWFVRAEIPGATGFRANPFLLLVEDGLVRLMPGR